MEKIFNIYREGDVISGSNLAKTFHKVLKDKEYIERMPKEKIETILLYNEQDVVNLYKIFIAWKDYIQSEDNVLEDDIEKCDSDAEKIDSVEEKSDVDEDIKEDKEKIKLAEVENTKDCILD